MKKIVVCCIVFALCMSLFVSSAVFAQEKRNITVTLDIPSSMTPALTSPQNVFVNKTIKVRLNNQSTTFKTNKWGYGSNTNRGNVTLDKSKNLKVTVTCSGLSDSSKTFRNVKSGANIIVTPKWRPNGPTMRITGWNISIR